MKKAIHFISTRLFAGGISTCKAQNWANGGNAVTANRTLRTTTDFSLSFKSNKKEHGRLTNNGLCGFGTRTPDSCLY
jgi:hypothetical protein